MFQGLISGLRELIFPDVCLSCGKKTGEGSSNILVCGACWSKIKKNSPPFCHSCGRKLDKRAFSKNICPLCQRKQLHFDRAFSPCSYEGVLKELIHKFKYRGKEHLSPILARPMIDFIEEFSLPIQYIDGIIPMPLHKARMREREFNQAESLSRHIAEKFGKELIADALERHRHTRPQAELKPLNRLENIKGCFRVKDNLKIRNKNLLLVDDVLTTGATASEAASCLKKEGANVVFVLTLAN